MPAIPAQKPADESDSDFNAQSDAEICANCLIREAPAVIINGTDAKPDQEFTNGDLYTIFKTAAEILRVRARDEFVKEQEQIAARQAELNRLLGNVDDTPKASGRKSGGKRTRASKDDVAAAQAKVLAVLPAHNVEEGQSLSSTKLVELSGIDASLWPTTARKLIADKKMVSRGAGRAMTYTAAESKQTAIPGTDAAAE
jgi:hypothetical protein